MLEIEAQLKKKMEQALTHIKDELKNIRTGRANPSMVENVPIEAYGTHMRLKDMATISAPEARQIVITPYDVSNLQNISKGIEKANLNLRPVIDGNLIRINIPPMDMAMRQDMVKQAHKKCEDGKISLRNIRRDYNELIKKQKKEGTITEDDERLLEKQVQKHTDGFCQEVDKLFKTKESEILVI